MKALELLEKVKAAVKLRQRLAQLDEQIWDAERYDPAEARELREARRELQAEIHALDAELQAEYTRLSRRPRRVV